MRSSSARTTPRSVDERASRRPLWERSADRMFGCELRFRMRAASFFVASILSGLALAMLPASSSLAQEQTPSATEAPVENPAGAEAPPATTPPLDKSATPAADGHAEHAHGEAS